MGRASWSDSATIRLSLPATRLLFALLPVLASCSEAVGPDRGDPSRFELSENVSFVCGGWFPRMPDAELGLFDVVTWRTENDPADRPSEAEIRRVLNAGGTIVYRFNTPKVRAILPVANVEALGRKVRSVSDRRSVEDTVFVKFRRVIDAAAVTDLGAEILRGYPDYAALLVRMPDPFVPNLRRDSRVEYVESDEDSICLQTSTAP